MKVSVIVPTYNGAHKILSILNALTNQTCRNYELLIVIDGSTDNTYQLLDKLPKRDFKILNQKNKGRAAVRNKGAWESTGDLLIFFDDDMRPTENCIHEHVQHHKKFSNSILGGAQIDDPKKATSSFQKYKCYLSNKWVSHLVNNSEALSLENLHLTAANFSIPKSLFLQLEGFDETLKDNEDFDLALRAYKRGINIFYNHNAFAWHDDFPTCEKFIKRQLEYKKFHKFVLLNKADLYGDVVRFNEKKNAKGIRELFYSFWKLDFWPSLVDKNFFSFLPLKAQFKIYNWIVFANTL